MKNFFKKYDRLIILGLGSFLFSQLSYGQSQSEIDSSKQKLGEVLDIGAFPKSAPDGLYKFAVSGNYRFFGTFLNMEERYIVTESPTGGNLQLPRTLFIGDDSQLPNFTLNFSGMPAKNTFWDFDLYAFQFLEGNVNPTYNGQIRTEDRPSIFNPVLATSKPGQSMGLLLGIRTNAGISTSFGTFGATIGGSQWNSISDLTMANFRGYNRFMLSERNPWDPVSPTIDDRYDDFYQFGNIDQDQRFGERVFNGFTLRATDLPLGFSVLAMVGKTEINGGFSQLPNTSYGGKISKDWKGNLTTSINTINNFAFIDSAGTQTVQMNVITGQAVGQIDDLQFDVEIGAGQYISGDQNYDWGEAINIKTKYPFLEGKLPIELQAYRIHPNVVNNNGIYWNTSIVEPTVGAVSVGGVGAAGASAVLLRSFASPIVPIGLTTNNRQGVNVNVEFEIADIKFAVANGIAEEIEALDNLIAFGNPVNQLTRSRFWRWDFPSNVGPYGRYNDIFRDNYQIMKLTDDSLNIPAATKKFNVMEFQARYKTLLWNRTLFVNVLNRYSSVQKDFSAFTVISEEAYLRHYSNELEVYYQLYPKIIVNGYAGYERILGNYDTQLSLENGRPTDQEGWGLGLGFDISLGKYAGLYARHRFFGFEDRSFTRDRFKGQETVLEIKVQF